RDALGRPLQIVHRHVAPRGGVHDGVGFGDPPVGRGRVRAVDPPRFVSAGELIRDVTPFAYQLAVDSIEVQTALAFLLRGLGANRRRRDRGLIRIPLASQRVVEVIARAQYIAVETVELLLSDVPAATHPPTVSTRALRHGVFFARR